MFGTKYNRFDLELLSFIIYHTVELGIVIHIQFFEQYGALLIVLCTGNVAREITFLAIHNPATANTTYNTCFSTTLYKSRLYVSCNL